MESKIESNAEYTLLSRGDEVYPSSACCGDASLYPGNRRHATTATGPPPDTVLIKTGGNALQAVQASVLENTYLMAASVPHNMSPGDKLLVVVPDGTDRTIQATIPKNVFPGHAFLIEVPPIMDKGWITTGIPLGDAPQTSPASEETTIVVGRHVEQTDLHLQQVGDVEMSATTEQQLEAESNHSRS